LLGSFSSITCNCTFRKDEELKQKVKDKQSRLVGKLFLSDDSDSDSDPEGEDRFPQTIKTLKYSYFSYSFIMFLFQVSLFEFFFQVFVFLQKFTQSKFI
jgi:hypothetical protein